jgi:hypothetical protein
MVFKIPTISSEGNRENKLFVLFQFSVLSQRNPSVFSAENSGKATSP